MSKRNARYEIFGRMFYDYLVLFKTNKTRLGLKTYKNDKILLDYIRKTTKNSRKELFDYLNEHQINHIVFDSDNNYEIKKFEFNEYYRLKSLFFLYIWSHINYNSTII